MSASVANQEKRLPPSILVVDDEPAVLLLTVHFLEMTGYQVFAASCGEEAIQIFQTHKDAITVALLDLHLPDLDGLEAMRALVQIKPSLACGIFSGTAEFDRPSLQGVGVRYVLQKPFPLAELDCLVKTLLGESLAVHPAEG